MQFVELISPKKYHINQIIIKKLYVKNLEKYACKKFNLTPSEFFQGNTIGINGNSLLYFKNNTKAHFWNLFIH
tara:strand:- start:4438 stop:4656 length:219 start_codon:yes stop_codon:yes gene_type:complete